MFSQLVIIALTGLATIISLFLFSSNTPQPESQSANIIEMAITPSPSTTPKRFDLGPSKRSNLDSTQKPLPSPTPPPIQTLTTTPVPSIAPTAIPTPTITPTATSVPTAISTPIPPPTSAPTTQHIFYTSSHWKAKYYYCDTDNDWKNLSPNYLKSFSSEAELLAAYSRFLHEPCKDY